MSTRLGVLGGRWDGMEIRQSPVLPMSSTDAQDARRIVRHGLADVLAWLGPSAAPGGHVPGPRPGEPVHAVEVHGVLFVSADLYADMVGMAATPSIQSLLNRRWGV